MTFTHLDEAGKAHMVDITNKPETVRTATAQATVHSTVGFDETQRLQCDWAARCAVKRTSGLIPLCHPLPIDDIDVTFASHRDVTTIEVTVTSFWRTGVEMEALTGATVAAVALVGLAGSESASVLDVAVWCKSGGRSGDWGRAIKHQTAQ